MSIKFTSKKRKIALIAIILGCIVAIAGIVTTSVLLSGKGTTLPDTPTVIQPIDPNPDIPTNPDQPTTPDEPDPVVPQKQLPILPTKGTVLRGFDRKNPVENASMGYWSYHLAVDFTANAGADVVSILDGIVESLGATSQSGTYVVILHSDNLRSVYKSLEPTLNVKVGDSVKQGQKIGTVGNTMVNELKDGSHLHFEMTTDKKPVNPADYIADLGNK